jgi:hypothetical protein
MHCGVSFTYFAAKKRMHVQTSYLLCRSHMILLIIYWAQLTMDVSVSKQEFLPEEE